MLSFKELDHSDPESICFWLINLFVSGVSLKCFTLMLCHPWHLAHSSKVDKSSFFYSSLSRLLFNFVTAHSFSTSSPEKKHPYYLIVSYIVWWFNYITVLKGELCFLQLSFINYKVHAFLWIYSRINLGEDPLYAIYNSLWSTLVVRRDSLIIREACEDYTFLSVG